MTPSGVEARSRPGRVTLAFAVLGAPAAWGTHLGLSYLIVPESCQAGTSLWLHAITVVTAVVGAAATVTAWRLLRRTRDEGDTGGGFVGGLGVVVGLLFTAALLVEGLPVALIDPCI